MGSLPEVPSTTHFRSARISASSAPARALRCLQPASILLYPLLALALRSLSPSAMNVVELTTKEEKDKLHADLVERLSDPSQNPYGDTDWLCQYFPMMSSMPNCRTFAAVLEEKNVGLMCSFEVRPTEIFLNGLRTDPSIRRRGFATQILKGMDSKLKAAGMTAIRMGVASWNEPMTKLSEEKLGLVGTEYCGIRCKEYAKEAEELPIRKATADDRAAIFALAHSDEMVGISGGFVQCAPGQFCAASAEYFDGVIAEGHTYVTESSDGGIGAVAVLSPNPSSRSRASTLSPGIQTTRSSQSCPACVSMRQSPRTMRRMDRAARYLYSSLDICRWRRRRSSSSWEERSLDGSGIQRRLRRCMDGRPAV